ncbi:glutathione S-transferase family protein [Burkholderia sp. KCJ3K979]|uniref:glutathione S-transferase family protein n=1 Tax=Burkholderia sp. KCJ3K979 TaxID=2759149 RepID=UPI001929F3B6|nr:glutathione S-transferase family protein [Burkholderia sp. KCJ3K979]MBL3960999.1 glutathione S-transferase family protein [Burkholderia sp. KCJ3K979]
MTAEFAVRSVVSSPYGRAVMATLEEKAADWALKEMAFGESRLKSHLALHPFGRLPVLHHGQFTLYETQAILRYLDRVLPEPLLTPDAPRAAARIDQLMGINDSYLFCGCTNVIVFQRLIGPALLGKPADLAAISEAKPRAHVAFDDISRILGSEDFLTGKGISLADLMIGAQLSLFSYTAEWDELTTGRDNLVAWVRRMEERPSFAKTRWKALVAGS